MKYPVGCFGPEASAYTKHLLTGRRVRLVYDRQLHDKYGRWLSAGYARTLSIPPNTTHAADLSALEREAALAGRGLWAACG